MVDFTIESWTSAASIGANQAVQSTVAFIPHLIYAVILLLVGFFISALIGRIVARIFEHLQIERAFKKYKVEDALGGNQITPILTSMLRWWVMLFFFQAAVEALKLMTLTAFITSALLYVPVIFGVVLFLIATAVVGEWVREAILDLHKFYLQRTVAPVAKWAIILVGLVVGLETAGFKMEFVRQIFNELLKGVMFGIAGAFALAFGLGGQKDATDMIKKVRKKFDF